MESAIAGGECLVNVGSSGEIDGVVITNVRSFFGRDFVKLLVVAAQHRRAGIGRALLQAATATTGTDVIFASTNESNTAMRALFEREDWTLSGTLTGIDEGDPELVFWRRRDERLPSDWV
jgi:ribosomal protein S18 acetylase RimI-like enzyme